MRSTSVRTVAYRPRFGGEWLALALLLGAAACGGMAEEFDDEETELASAPVYELRGAGPGAGASCKKVTCTAHATCKQGACVCDPGYTPSGSQCVNPCAGITCSVNEVCASGSCRCANGFTDYGDGCEPTDPCHGVTCGANASCVSGACVCAAGYVSSQGGCVLDPCTGVTCPANEGCIDGGCACLPGYTRVGTTCALDDLAQRTAATVCARWTQDWPLRTNTYWYAGANSCSPGSMNAVAHDDAMRRLNLYRWLVGLSPSSVDPAHEALAQAAAQLMNANNALSHEPPSTWTCYSADGATGARNSNIALGFPVPADTVDAYIKENGVPSLGHRRWIFYPQMDYTGFGHYDRGGAMWALGYNGAAPAPAYIAYPSAGAFPRVAIKGPWSFSKPTAFGAPTATITALSNNHVVPVTVANLENGYGYATISMTLGEVTVAGETYRVVVRDGASTWTYDTTLVTCP